MRTLIRTAAAFLVAASLVACGGSPSSPSSGPDSVQSRTFVDDNGVSVTMPDTPTRIVSTSVTLTGTLLALDAPVIGSGGSKPNAQGLDSHGWFLHWSSVAEERGVESLYTNQNVDLEAVTAADPEVIIMSKTGGDSAMEQYEQLKAIAPTVVIDYNSTDWREVTRRVAEAIGTPEKAESVLADYDAHVKEVEQQISAPADPVDLAVYSGDNGLSVGLPTAPQALVLQQLGITVKDEGVVAEKGRTDFAFTSKEQALEALRQDTLLLVGNSDSDKQALLADPAFAELPAVKSGRIHALGDASFKLDYYAAKDLVDHARQAFLK